MLDKFWESLASNLANKWVALSAPALMFWFGGALAWASHHGGYAGLRHQLTGLNAQPGPVQIGIVALALLSVAASTVVVNQLTDYALPLLEGYWPRWAAPLRDRLTGHKQSHVQQMHTEWAALARGLATASAAERRRYLELDNQLRTVPGDRTLLLPTRLGNILRAAEGQPYDRYGLESTVVWPRLWLVLPQSVRDELTGARSALNNSVSTFIWSILFCSFSGWNALAAAAGIVVALITYFALLPARASTFGALFEAAFDLHRIDLFRALRWPLPAVPSDDRRLGLALSEYLFRGTTTLDAFASPTSEEHS
jgi:hypothetical protein